MVINCVVLVVVGLVLGFLGGVLCAVGFYVDVELWVLWYVWWGLGCFRVDLFYLVYA